MANQYGRWRGRESCTGFQKSRSEAMQYITTDLQSSKFVYKPLVLWSSTRIISFTNSFGALLMILYTDLSSVDRCSLWKGMIKLVVGRYIWYFFFWQLGYEGKQQLIFLFSSSNSLSIDASSKFYLYLYHLRLNIRTMNYCTCTAGVVNNSNMHKQGPTSALQLTAWWALVFQRMWLKEKMQVVIYNKQNKVYQKHKFISSR